MLSLTSSDETGKTPQQSNRFFNEIIESQEVSATFRSTQVLFLLKSTYRHTTLFNDVRTLARVIHSTHCTLWSSGRGDYLLNLSTEYATQATCNNSCGCVPFWPVACDDAESCFRKKIKVKIQSKRNLKKVTRWQVGFFDPPWYWREGGH